ncbi:MULTISPECIES: hypothetical protein [Pseudophaeobacter]|nr:hypothetical protein [Pseudophaeobacter profundi]
MKTSKPVLGRIAPNPRATLTAAFVLASLLSIPVFVVLTLIDLLLW